jgi:hypothetical protein
VSTKKGQSTNENKDEALRRHLLYMLRDSGAHAKFDGVVANFPPRLRGKRVEGLPYTAWMLLAHMRIAQWDILDFSVNPKYKAMDWPEGYWPKSEGPPSAAAWNDSVKEFKKDLKAIAELVENSEIDLYAKIPWGEGQTILREVLLVADHNAYHLGQLVTLRRLLGAWKE